MENNLPNSSSSNSALLEADSISLDYQGPLVLENVSFTIPQGQRVAVVGPNGAGKSTLFKALVGLLPLRSGSIRIHGKPLGGHKDCVAYIPQREEVDWRFPVTVEDVVMMSRFDRIGWISRPSRTDRDIVNNSMHLMGITQLAKRPIGELSGGQQQRVFLARALAQEPHILLMDEPFNGVDVSTQEIVLGLLNDLRDRRVTVLVSTHDLSLAAQRFDRVMLLKRRLVALGAPGEVFTRKHVSEGFGEQVLYVDGAAVIDQCCPGDELDHHEKVG